jgi:hypothetical protein
MLQADGSVFNLRAKNVYELVNADLYSTHNKHWHIVRRLQLPDVPRTATLPCGTPLDKAGYPPLLILHILMPMYPAQFFFPQTDGANVSFVYYFRLPEGFDPATHEAPEVRPYSHVLHPCTCTVTPQKVILLCKWHSAYSATAVLNAAPGCAPSRQ